MTRVDLPEPETPVTQQNTPSGNVDVDVLQVVLAGAPDRPARRSACAALAGTGIACSPAQVLAGERRGIGARSRPASPRATTSPAVLAGARPEVDDVVGGADRALVVLDHDHGVAEVAQALERVDQLLVVALVQPDRRLVEDVEHARPGSSRSASPAGSAAPRRRRAWPRPGPASGSRCRRCRGTAAARRSRGRRAGRSRARSRSARALDPGRAPPAPTGRVLVDVEPADRDREALRPKPGAAAGRAGLQAISPSIRSRVFSDSVFS